MNAEATSYYCGIFAADFAVPFYMIFFLFQFVYLYEQSDSRRDRVAGIGANGDAMAGIGDRCQSHGIGGPSGQLKTVSCFTSAAKTKEDKLKTKRLKSNCSLLVPACGSLSLSAGQQ